MWERVREVGTVIVITWLIWWSADRRVTDRAEFPLRIAVRSARPGVQATVESPRPAEVRVTVEGTRGRLEAFRALLQRNRDLQLEHVVAADESSPGTRTLSAAVVLGQTAIIHDAGVTIVDVRPAEISVVFERLVDVSVRIEPSFGTVGVENVVCQPATVEVRRLPERVAHERLADGVLRPWAEQALKQWLASNPDRASFSIDLALSIPDAPQSAEFSPSSTVRVAGRFVNLFTTAKKGPVQIVFAIPPELERQYLVRPAEGSNFRPDVEVRGPTAAVEQLTPQQVLVFVDVLTSDAAGTVRTIRRMPRAVLPPGLELAREMQEVAFELVEHGSNGGPDGDGAP
ncbi:MAG: hypothetical protein U1A27_07690 [Phycisphaerae bacterium]